MRARTRSYYFLVFQIVSLLCSGSVDAACKDHDPLSADVPICPANGNTLLSENYPTLALLISDAEGHGHPTMTVNYALGALKSQPSKPPQILLVASNKRMKQIGAAIKKSAPDTATAKKWLASITQVKNAEDILWHQDFFESFISPKTGLPHLRSVQNIYGGPGEMENVMAALKNCPVGLGESLIGAESILHGRRGYEGGNLEALGELCVVGKSDLNDDEWKKYVNQFCGSDQNAIAAPTEFLSAKHVDEIFKTVPLQGKSAPCNFSIALASPDKALELLKANPEQPWLHFQEARPPRFHETFELDEGPIRDFCSRLEGRYSANAPKRKTKLSQLIKTREESRGRSRKVASEGKERAFACLKATNEDVLRLFGPDTKLGRYNQLVQAKMTAFKKELLAKLNGRPEHCTPTIVDVPDLFQGDLEVVNGEERLIDGSATSIWPNPSNGEVVGNTMIFSDPANAAFRDYLRDTFPKVTGLNITFVDSYIFHIGGGNLHCASHSIRYCRPAKNQ